MIGQQGGFVREVGKQSIAPFVMIHAVADMAVEVAIWAFRYAERPMDVERKRRVAVDFRAPA